MFGQAFTHQIPTGGEHLYGIGTAKPQEIQQLRMSPQLTVEQFELTAVGRKLLQGGQNLAYIIVGRQFEIHVAVENPAGGGLATIYTYVGCKAQNFSGNIPANAPVRDTITFLALDVLDDQGSSVLDASDNALSVVSAAASAGAGLAANGLGLVT